MSASAFISYSRDDSEFALRLARDLKAADARRACLTPPSLAALSAERPAP